MQYSINYFCYLFSCIKYFYYICTAKLLKNKIMTQEQEELLLKDLCARLPYGVILNCCEIVSEPLTLISYKGLINNDYDIDEVKPYLFPLSSMTEEQNLEYLRTCIGGNASVPTLASFDWFNKNHFDYQGLIPMGLAEDATGKNIY